MGSQAWRLAQGKYAERVESESRFQPPSDHRDELSDRLLSLVDISNLPGVRVILHDKPVELDGRTTWHSDDISEAVLSDCIDNGTAHLFAYGREEQL